MNVFRNGRLVLSVEDRPGVLLSTAAPPPTGAPEHPFVNARAHDPFSEQDLATVLGSAHDYDSFLALLVQSGFDLSPSGELELGGAQRFHAAGEVAGCAWPRPGPIATLGAEPETGWRTAVFALTCYAEEVPPGVLEVATSASSLSDLLEGVVGLGYTTGA